MLAVEDNLQTGMKLIHLRWPELDPSSYQLYQIVKGWLREKGISELFFVWDDTGKYLPSAVMLEPEDAAAFLLKFG